MNNPIRFVTESLENIDKKINPLFEGLVDRIKRFYKRTLSKIHYDLYEEIKNSEFKKGKLKPHIAARKWFRSYAKEKINQQKGYLVQGKLYMYRYKYPKFMDTLDFWDTEPLMLCLGRFKTKEGKVREVGINLHLLPLRVRILVLYEITNRVYKTQYKSQLYKEPQREIGISWQELKEPLERFGVGFAIRMYIPLLRRETVEFKVEDYSKAIYLTSRLYQKTTPEELNKLWIEYTKKQKLKAVANEHFNQSM